MVADESPAAPPSTADRRQHRRVALLTQVEARGSEDFVVGESHDISEGGLSVGAARTFVCGTEVVVRFYLPPFPPGYFAEIEGMIVWTVTAHSMGIRFLKLSEPTRQAIVRYVRLDGNITEKGFL
ncbi:MAG TPA: PilZ domain-containing protein [Terriglobia bacterium]|nr:PilZ domain-containing protein [Terriglobia bacterium]